MFTERWALRLHFVFKGEDVTLSIPNSAHTVNKSIIISSYIYNRLHVSAWVSHLQRDSDSKECVQTHNTLIYIKNQRDATWQYIY